MMSTVTQNSARRVAAAAIVLGLVACQGEVPTAADAAVAPASFAIGDNTTTSTPEFGKIKVCKSASSNVSGSFTFSRRDVGVSSGGTALANATIAPNTCTIVAEDNGPNGVFSGVTITETSDGYVSVAGRRINNPGGESDFTYVPGGELLVNSFHGFTVTYYNFVEPPPPPSGNNGCSPGYWKNHKFPPGYSSSTTFASVFDNNSVYGTATLLTVLKTGGGGLAALGRQTVSAFFNATVYDDFGYTPAEVVSAFNTAVAGSAADQNALKDAFEAKTDVNGRTCTNPTGK